MTARLDDPTSAADPVLRGVLGVTLAITLVGMLVLIRTAVGGGGVDHVTVRIDNQGGVGGPGGCAGRLGVTGSGWAKPSPRH